MAARIVSQSRWPYLSSQLFSLKLVEVPHSEIQTMAVDKGWRMYYSPQFVMEQPVEVLATALLHEALHCVMRHNERYEAFGSARGYHTLWNFCGDAAINEILDGQDMPWGEFSPVRYEGFPVPEVVSGLITETAYGLSVEWAKAHQDESDGLESDCGSSSGGEARDYELEPNDESAPAIQSDQQNTIRDQVASDVLDYAKNRGSLPGGLTRWAESYLNPQVDWRKQLAVRMRQIIANVSGRRNHSYVRPSRRQDAMRDHDDTIILPGLRASEPPRVAVIVDTSGSVSSQELNQALTEIKGISKAVGMREAIAVIACDAKAYPARYVRSSSSITDLKLEGGGGTDLREGITASLELPKKPALVILISDGESPYPVTSPDPTVQFIMVLTGRGSVPSIPAWITQIRIER
jgi:predicted metal-dependent peptidase